MGVAFGEGYGVADALPLGLRDAEFHHLAGEVEADDGGYFGSAGEVEGEVAGAGGDVEGAAM